MEQAAVAAGVPPEPRPFHPHVTLGRVKGRLDRRVVDDLVALPELGEVPLDTLTLYKSDLKPAGGPLSLALLLALSTASASDVRVAFGGQLETQSHGILDLGWRRGPLSIQWLTDTLDLRLTEQRDRGRWSLGVRAASFAAGMWITPWANGAPDLSRAQQASYFGPDAEVQRYLPGGSYVGGAGFFRPHRFRPLRESTLRLPDTYWGRAQLVAGVWRDDGRLQARLAAGADATTPGRVAPHVLGDASWRTDRALTPLVELHAGFAENQDDITATRIGGLTPYTLPFAGAAWAELWVATSTSAR